MGPVVAKFLSRRVEKILSDVEFRGSFFLRVGRMGAEGVLLSDEEEEEECGRLVEGAVTVVAGSESIVGGALIDGEGVDGAEEEEEGEAVESAEGVTNAASTSMNATF